MKAITILEPWASLILGCLAGQSDGTPALPKRIENRNWRTSHRGPLAIHAGLSKRLLRDKAGSRNDHWPVVELAGGLSINVDADQMTFGAIIGVVDLVACIHLEDLQQRPESLREFWPLLDDPYTEGEWLWVLENPRRLAKPIPWKGKQKLFDVPDELFA